MPLEEVAAVNSFLMSIAIFWTFNIFGSQGNIFSGFEFKSTLGECFE